MPRIFTAKNGDRLVRSFTIKVFAPGNKRFKVQRFTAPSRDPKAVDDQGKPAGRNGFTPNAVQLALERVSDALAEHYPGHEFRLVELAPDRFNIVHERWPVAAPAPPKISAVAATMAMAATVSGRGRYQTVDAV